MPNLDPWISGSSNKNEDITTNTINEFENHFQSIKAEHQERIRPNLHPTFNERHQKIIEMIDWTLEKYKAAVANTQKMNQQDEEIIIENIIEELDKKKDIARSKMKKALLKDEVSLYRLEENTVDYILFRIRESTGKLY